MCGGAEVRLQKIILANPVDLQFRKLLQFKAFGVFAP